MNPEISVILPVYNGGKYLKEAIDSILNQTFKNFELIIVNDGSTDESLYIIRSYKDERIKLINQKNTGLSKALNNGIKLAKGKYIARMDQDDISHPERLKKQIKFMESHTDYVAIGTYANYISKNGEFLYTSKTPYKSEDLKNGLPYVCPFVHSSVMMRVDALKKVGGYKNVGRYFYQEDILLWIDLSKEGEFYNILESLLNFRITPSSCQQHSHNYFPYQMEIVKGYYETGKLDYKKINMIKPAWGFVPERLKYSNYYAKIGSIYLNKNFNRKLAQKNLIKALHYNMLNKKPLINLGLSLLPQNINNYLKYLKRNK